MGWIPFIMNDRKRMPGIDRLLLLLILGIAIFLRFYRVSDIPFTQDEFSAIFRTDYSGISDLIEYGVKPDGHPAGIQLLLWSLIRIFGVSELLLKLPFLLFGVFSLFLAFRIARTWFNDTVALLTISLLAVLQYMVYYSQIARPYMSGMFFSLWMVWCWTRFVLHPGKNDVKNLAGMVLAAICCAYNHHFSLLFAGVVWLTGVFLIDRRRLRYYVLGGALILIAYFPHLPVLIHQMKMRGVEEWLAKPDLFFVIDYITYGFHFSPLLMLVVGFIGLTGFILRSKEPSGKPSFRLIALVWFLILLVAGFIYSLLVSAVLQYSVLIFAFPFLGILLFSFFPELRTSWKILPVSLILATGTFTLFLNRHHYELFYGSGPGKILQETGACVEKYGTDRVSVVFHADRRTINYTLSSLDAGLNREIFYIEDSTIFPDFRDYLSHVSTNYLIYAWTAPLAIEYEELIKEYFPYHLEWKESFLTEFHLFSRIDETGHFSNKMRTTRTEHEPGELLPGYPLDHFTETICFGGKRCYLIDSLTRFSPPYLLDLDKLDLNRNDYITVTLSLFLNDQGSNPVLVGSIESGGEELIWRGNSARDFLSGSNQWGKVYLSMRLPGEVLRKKNLVFKTYLWNRDGADFYIDDFEITVYEGNQRLYGLFEAIE